MMERLKEIGLVFFGILKSLSKLKSLDDQPLIDFVVTWVDGNDSAWQKERNEYLGNDDSFQSDNGCGRYRDWSSFRYWFRAVETFAPWVRYVHLVTWGHVPEWLNKECPKLKIVTHKDYMPTEFLPTYNSISLEFNLFRIPELSENFVYFNDDMLLARPVSPTDFFVNGMPLHTCTASPWVNRDNDINYHIFFNTYGVVNKYNNISNCIKNHPEKWFSYKNLFSIKYNLDAYRNCGLSGMHFTHMGVPLCKSTMEKVWQKYNKECVDTCNCRLRQFNQITHQIFSIEDILNGNFIPSSADWGSCIAIDNINGIRDAYEKNKGKMICLFDRDNLTKQEVEDINDQLTKVFNNIFPQKSSFEL